MKIGFFDSGLGGLIIMQSVIKHLPQYDYEFYGDTKHVPYGDKTEGEIYELTKAGVEYLFNQNCALVIIACNTASAETLRRLQETVLVDKYKKRRILGVIVPTVEAVVESGVTELVLLATKRTVASQKYEREFSKHAPTVQLSGLSLAGLVPLLETGQKESAVKEILAVVKAQLMSRHTNFILGCTHYSLLKAEVRQVVGRTGVVFSQDEIIPLKLQDYLERHPELESTLTRLGTKHIYLTKPRSDYAEIVTGF